MYIEKNIEMDSEIEIKKLILYKFISKFHNIFIIKLYIFLFHNFLF